MRKGKYTQLFSQLDQGNQILCIHLDELAEEMRGFRPRRYNEEREGKRFGELSVYLEYLKRNRMDLGSGRTRGSRLKGSEAAGGN